MTVTRYKDYPLFQSYYRPDRFEAYKGLPNLKCMICDKCSPILFDMENHLYLDHGEFGCVRLTRMLEKEAIRNGRRFGCEDG
jgi:hypothetical protein